MSTVLVRELGDDRRVAVEFPNDLQPEERGELVAALRQAADDIERTERPPPRLVLPCT